MSVLSNVNGKSLSYQAQEFSSRPLDPDTDVYRNFDFDLLSPTSQGCPVDQYHCPHICTVKR